MKQIFIMAATITLALVSQIATSGTITDTYATGDTLTATKLNNIKTAVNDNDTTKQDRVTGTCPTNQSIRVINSDGTVVCEVISDPTATMYHSIPGAAFLPESSSLIWIQSSTTYKYLTGGGNSFYAPVELPHGVIMTNFSCRVRDASTSYSVAVQLYRKEVAIASAATTILENPIFITISSAINSSYETVNNSGDARYQIKFTVDNSLCGASCGIATCTILYTVP
jgi:hypothetical protein